MITNEKSPGHSSNAPRNMTPRVYICGLRSPEREPSVTPENATQPSNAMRPKSGKPPVTQKAIGASTGKKSGDASSGAPMTMGTRAKSAKIEHESKRYDTLEKKTTKSMNGGGNEKELRAGHNTKKSMKPGGGGRFAALKSKIAAKGNVRDPGAVAAAIGRKKYGAKKMTKWSVAGRKRV